VIFSLQDSPREIVASSMCFIRVRSSGGIVGFRLGGDFISEVFADHFGGTYLDGVAVNEFGEFLLHSGELDEAWDVIRIEFDEDVDIALWGEVGAQD